jgi:hypothetical protein
LLVEERVGAHSRHGLQLLLLLLLLPPPLPPLLPLLLLPFHPLLRVTYPLASNMIHVLVHARIPRRVFA